MMLLRVVVLLWIVLSAVVYGREKPQLVIQAGHSSAILSVSVAPDRRLAATVGQDGTIKLWDLVEGRIISTLAPNSLLEKVAFSSDGAWLAGGSGDGTVYVWSSASSRLGFPPLQHSGDINDLRWHPTQPYLAVACDDKTVRIWNLSTEGRPEVEVTLASHRKPIRAVAFTPDGSRVATGSDDGTVRVWEFPSGEPMVRLEPDATVYSLNFVGETLIVNDRPWDMARRTPGPALFSAPARTVAVSRDGSVVVGNIAHNKLEIVRGGQRRTLQQPDLIQSIALSSDGRMAATGSFAYQDGTALNLWDLTTDSEAVRLRPPAGRYSRGFFTPDGKRLINLNSLGVLKVWDLQSGRQQKIFGSSAKQNTLPVPPVVVTPDGRHAITLAGLDDNPLAVVKDLETGRTVFTSSDPVATLDLAPDGRTLWLLHRPRAFRPGQPVDMNAPLFSVVQIPSGQVTARFGRLVNATGALAMCVGAKGDTAYVVFLSGLMQRWKLGGMRADQEVMAPERLRTITVSPDRSRLALAAIDGAVYLMDAARFPDVRRVLEGGLYEERRSNFGVAFSADGNFLAVAGMYQLVVLDLARGGRRFTVKGGGFHDVAFHPNGRTLLTSSWTLPMQRLWSMADGNLLATVVDMEGDDWLVATPDGLFDGSPAGTRLIDWRIGNDLFRIDQFFNQFYTPHLLAQLMGTSPLGSRAVPTAKSDISQSELPPAVVIVSPRQNSRTASASVTVEVGIEDRGSGYSNPRLYLNGHRLSDRAITGKRGTTLSFKVDLLEGENRIRATAFSGNGKVESRGSEITVMCDVEAPQKARLFVLAVGIDKYRNSQLNLGFAVADARAIAQFFRPGLYSEIISTTVFNEKATREGVLQALRKVAAIAHPRDTVVIYLAGHGTLVGDLFYFLPHDVKVNTDAEISSSGIASSELAERLADIPATKQVVILDACHAGGATSALGKLLATRDALALIRAQQRLARASGTFLIAAATSQQYAHEVPELGHGVLTSALLKGLRPKGAAPNPDGQVTVNALLRFLSDEVPQMTRKYRGSRQDIVQFSTGQDFPLVLTGLGQGGR